MDRWMAELSRPRETELQAFERAVTEFGRSEMEKNAGDFSEAMDSLMETPSRTPRVDRLLEQTSVASNMGRDLARQQEMAKQAGIAGTVMGAIKPLAGKALGWAAQHPTHALAAGGAALGALGGAATAQPGHRLGGALGGAALGGAAGYGASKLPRGYGQKLTQGVADYAAKGWNALGQPKLAGVLSTGLGRAGLGAVAGGALGALHSNDAARQGLAPAHHLRNALIGAAGGAALGGALHHMPTGMGAAAEEAAHVAPRPPMQMHHNPYTMATAAEHTPDEIRQMHRVRDMARAEDARKVNLRQAQAAPTRAANQPTAAPPPPAAGTMMGKKPVGIAHASTQMAKLAQRGGREFLKMAFSMSAQGEQGDPTGAEDPDTDSQFIAPAPPARGPSKPAMELYDALKHLSPKSMRGLQVAQPGT